MFRAFLLLVCSGVAIVTPAKASRPCHSVAFTVALEVYDDFEQPLGGDLLFRVKTLSEPGWFFDIVPADATGNDYIYPVNPPLRFNGSQYFGAAYSESVKTSVSYPHEMRFLLDRTDYDHVSSLTGNVLWPYQASNPDKALSNYRTAVKNAKKGWLNVAVSSYKLDAKTGELAHIELRVQVTGPLSFQFAPELKSKTESCPSDPK